MIQRLLSLLFLIAIVACNSSKKSPAATLARDDPHRPQIHFTPTEKWMNDPNGMVFFNNKYHLFYQYYPDSTIWGPMHWAHATSPDLIHWDHEPVALYPDSLGYIFSGSAVVDSNNTSGLGKEGKIPLVAIFTHHDPKGEKQGRQDFQYQSIAYSLDEGKTWTKYPANPVLKNPGIKDFRDPKVFWHEPSKKWIMTLATLDRITFYSSANLIQWEKQSEFGKDFGGHGGVWECPDLFPLQHEGKKIWVLLVSINPGGPNGGSATQYFTGDFDGKTFTPLQTDTRWLDYGPDNYAGVTWSNTGDRKIFLGWMSNWQYANLVPTGKWRGAATIPRDLGLKKIGDKYYVTSTPSQELRALEEKAVVMENVAAGSYDLTEKMGSVEGAARIDFNSSALGAFAITLSNNSGQQIVIGYDSSAQQYYIDRSRSGKIDFEKDFGKKHVAPLLSNDAESRLTLFIDRASVELFAGDGVTVMTAIFFPDGPLSKISVKIPEVMKNNMIRVTPIRSIYTSDN